MPTSTLEADVIGLRPYALALRQALDQGLTKAIARFQVGQL